MYSNHLDDECCSVLAQSLINQPLKLLNLCKIPLKLASNKIKNNGIISLVNSLKWNILYPLSLIIGYNEIKQKGFNSLAELIKTIKIDKLCIENSAIEIEALKKLSNAISNSKRRLKLFNISANNLTNDSAEFISEIMKNTSQIFLENNNFNNDGISKFESLNDVNVISLYNNPIEDAGLEILSDKIKSRIKKIILEHCKIQDHGVKRLANTLSESMSLQLLNLSNVHI